MGQLVGVLENIGHEGIDGIVGDIVGSQNHRAHGDGLHIAVQALIGVCGNGDGHVVGALCDKGIGVLLVDADQMHVLAGGQVGDGHGGRTGHNEGCVDLAVLQGGGAVAEALVLGLDVLLGQAAVSYTHLPGCQPR